MLASDFVLQGAVTLLEKVRDGELRLDRTIEVSVTNTAEKKQHPAPARAEPDDARPPAASRIARDYPHRHQQAQPTEASAARPGAAWFAAATRPCGWSKN